MQIQEFVSVFWFTSFVSLFSETKVPSGMQPSVLFLFFCVVVPVSVLCSDDTTLNTNHTYDFITDPVIFLLGVKRGATTSLDSLLRRNAGICDSGEKETGFFNKFWDRGTQYYKS